MEEKSKENEERGTGLTKHQLTPIWGQLGDGKRCAGESWDPGFQSQVCHLLDLSFPTVNGELGLCSLRPTLS